MRIGLTKPENGNNTVSGKVDDVGYLGSTSQYHTILDATKQRITVLRANAGQTAETSIKWEDKVWIDWPAEAGVVLTR
jgi:putrescine transport system ATP-binding protein